MKTTTLLRVEKAQENSKIAQEIGESSSGHRGWKVTLLFYSALFWVRAYFEEATILDEPSHFKRLATLRRTKELEPIDEAFRELQDLSEDARYELNETGQTRVDLALLCHDEIRDLIARLLAPERTSPESAEDATD